MSFFKSSRTSRYLLYAFGEIFLVVIGILIALQINNWNEWRRDRTKEKQVLNEILVSLEKNKEVLLDRLYWINEFQKSSQVILMSLDGKIPFSDTLGTHFSRARFTGVGNISGLCSESGYTALKLTGYNIIKSDNLKLKIVEAFESTLPVLFAAAEYNFHKNLQEYYLRNFKDGGKLPHDFSLLKQDLYFQEMISNIIGYRNRIKYRIENYLNESDKLMMDIRQALKDRS
tara:strand:- start:329 stop:1018 length:690 start_codon:yes stop_codon:yes gene_type:complete